MESPTLTLRANRASIVTYWCLGVPFAALVLLCAVLPLLHLAPWSLAILGLLLLPMTWWLFRNARILARTSLTLDAGHLHLAIPRFAAGFLIPRPPVTLPWADVLDVTEGRGDYRIPLVLPAAAMTTTFSVQEFTIHTRAGRFVLTRHLIARPDAVARLIAERCQDERRRSTP